jgi:ASC-1-like (ASCH) protein
MVRTLWVKKEFLDLILAGKKTVEVRVLYPNLRSLKRGEVVKLNGKYPFKVKDIRVYKNFAELANGEDAGKIVPGKTAAGLLEILRSLYPSEKESLGAVAIELAGEDKL